MHKILVTVLMFTLTPIVTPQQNPANMFLRGPLAAAPLTPQGIVPPDGIAEYVYGYKTEDPDDSTFSEQFESRQGDSTNGFYSVLLPDGRVQVVNYVADENGYRATVTYETTAGQPLPGPLDPPGDTPRNAAPFSTTLRLSGQLPPLTADIGVAGTGAFLGTEVGSAGSSGRSRDRFNRALNQQASTSNIEILTRQPSQFTVTRQRPIALPTPPSQRALFKTNRQLRKPRRKQKLSTTQQTFSKTNSIKQEAKDKPGLTIPMITKLLTQPKLTNFREIPQRQPTSNRQRKTADILELLNQNYNTKLSFAPYISTGSVQETRASPRQLDNVFEMEPQFTTHDATMNGWKRQGMTPDDLTASPTNHLSHHYDASWMPVEPYIIPENKLKDNTRDRRVVYIKRSALYNAAPNVGITQFGDEEDTYSSYPNPEDREEYKGDSQQRIHAYTRYKRKNQANEVSTSKQSASNYTHGKDYMRRHYKVPGDTNSLLEPTEQPQ